MLAQLSLCVGVANAGLLIASAEAGDSAEPGAALEAAPPRVPALPSDEIRDALHVRGELLLGTSRGLYALALPSLEPTASSAPGSALPPADLSRSIWRTVLGRTGVQQLSAGASGLWIATENGLWSWDFEREPVRVPEVGGAALGVVETADGEGWAASEDGLFFRAAGERRWVRSDALPERDVAALHVVRPSPQEVVLRARDLPSSRDRASAPELNNGATPIDEGVWAATPGSLWRLQAGGRFERVLAGLAEGWWELRGVVRTIDTTWLVVPEGLWLIENGRIERLPLGPGELTSVAPTAEPGLVAVVRDQSAACVSSDRRARRATSGRAFGLLREATEHSRWLLVPDGLERLRCTSAVAGPVAPGPSRPKSIEPGRKVVLPTAAEVERLHAAVLDYLDLTPRPLRELEGRTRRRGLWPELRIGMAMDSLRARELGRDQSFTSGELRDLSDTLRERQRDSTVDVQLLWRLGERADPTDMLAISRERRERIELREQVLERVDQIFFERARIRARMAGDEELPPTERLELEIRAQELAASLDAWTGGAFSRDQTGTGVESGAQTR